MENSEVDFRNVMAFLQDRAAVFSVAEFEFFKKLDDYYKRENFLSYKQQFFILKMAQLVRQREEKQAVKESAES